MTEAKTEIQKPSAKVNPGCGLTLLRWIGRTFQIGGLLVGFLMIYGGCTGISSSAKAMSNAPAASQPAKSDGQHAKDISPEQAAAAAATIGGTLFLFFGIGTLIAGLVIGTVIIILADVGERNRRKNLQGD